MQSTPNPLVNFVPMLAILAIFYFLVIRPQQTQQKNHERALRELKIGDKILTSGGLYGTVTGFKGDDLEVQFSQTVRLTVARSAVSKVTGVDAAKSAA